MLPCAACGFETVDDETYGSYAICDVCGWEDDGVQLANPCSDGGANGKSLAQWQKVVLEKFPIYVDMAKGFWRSARWRPLNTGEMEMFDAQRRMSHWANNAVLEECEAYWVTLHNSLFDTDASRRST